MGSLSLLQGTFPTQGLNPGLPRCRQSLYQLSHKGSPRTLKSTLFDTSFANPALLLVMSIWHSLVTFLIFNFVLLLLDVP